MNGSLQGSCELIPNAHYVKHHSIHHVITVTICTASNIMYKDHCDSEILSHRVNFYRRSRNILVYTISNTTLHLKHTYAHMLCMQNIDHHSLTSGRSLFKYLYLSNLQNLVTLQITNYVAP